MNVSLGTLFVVTVATAASALLVLMASPIWIRTRRARRLATVDLLLATSYLGTSRGVGSTPTRAGVSTERAMSAPDDDAPEPVATTAERPRHDVHRALLDAVAFEAILDHEDAREERYRRPTTVVILELDGLDRLVERLGDDAAARLEPDVAQTIARLARRADYVARLAHGRFAVLMPETDEIVAINYVERIRQACDEWLESGAIAMRLAIGWASTTGAASVSTALQVAVDRMHAEQRRHARLTSDGAGDAPTV